MVERVRRHDHLRPTMFLPSILRSSGVKYSVTTSTPCLARKRGDVRRWIDPEGIGAVPVEKGEEEPVVAPDIDREGVGRSRNRPQGCRPGP